MAYSQQNTSFIPKSKQKTCGITGTLPSLHNNLLLTSTGVPTIDDVIGCIPVGTVLLLEEDKYSHFSQILLKCFAAEGIANGHDIFLASVDPKTFLETLPNPVDSKPVDPKPVTNDELKIAWRYEKNRSKTVSKYRIGHNFNLSKPITTTQLEKANIFTFDVLKEEDKGQHICQNLINEVKLKLTNGNYTVSGNQIPNKVFRIAINGLGSPMWPSGTANSEHILKLLYRLRFLLRSSMAVCMISVPTYLFEDTSIISKLRHLSDTVIKLDSFTSSEKETNPNYKDFLGFFSIEKLPSLNSLVCHHEYTQDLVFTISRKRFIIEKLYLPPLEATEPRVQNYCTSKPGTKTSIDF